MRSNIKDAVEYELSAKDIKKTNPIFSFFLA
jgi:hypothetical protein